MGVYFSPIGGSAHDYSGTVWKGGCAMGDRGPAWLLRRDLFYLPAWTYHLKKGFLVRRTGEEMPTRTSFSPPPSR